MSREVKFQAMTVQGEWKTFTLGDLVCGDANFVDGPQFNPETWRQFTGLKDKNGNYGKDVYEGDIIDKNGFVIGNIYENDPRKSDLVIPQAGTKAWQAANEEAMVRGLTYAK